ncbi:hypothetical protein AWZ03_007967 [Drosophila navojoa]|uniref:Kazal-like domain-containing protein n=1 Tax=Drosophila navojoa TaxID=7232 RepID=A0A484B9Q1_DRONA|nr:hypothetical protein AWZ03_007967 [Drosophila navojoa]
MGKLLLVLATVLLCSAFVTAQVKPNEEIGRVTVQVPLLSNGKPVMSQDKELVEVARVVEVKPGKLTPEEVVVPLVKVRNMRAIRDTENPSKPNPGIPNPGMPNPGIPNRGMPNPGIETPGMPNPGIPNPGMPNPGIPNRAVVAPANTTTAPGPIMIKGAKSCHQLLLASSAPAKPLPVQENCDQLCTKFELMPICAYNGICIHEFPNQCVMDTFNCKHRDLEFRAVDEDICMMDLCARRCKEQDLKM